MAKPKHKEVKFSAKEMADDLPDELDFSKLKFVGRGKDAIFRKHEAEKTVVLDPDVAEVFADSKTVNNALRGLIEIAKQSVGKRRRTA
jgi:hypothetical protein